jgi:sporadic carbohydrate cluster protein (TIGR04323 family)
MPDKFGYRGYVYSRPILGERIPQAVQNLVIRNYCRQNNFTYLLSATEYAMPECFMILDGVAKELEEIEGLVAYSIFMLPRDRDKRWHIYDSFNKSDCALCGAIEGIVIKNISDAEQFEQTWAVRQIAEQNLAADVQNDIENLIS